MHQAHFRSQCRLVTHRTWHTTKQCRYLRTSLCKTEYIIYEKQNIFSLTITFTITEIFRHRQTTQRHTSTSTRRFVHLSKYESSFRIFQTFHIYRSQIPSTFFHAMFKFLTIVHNTCFNHFTHQIITLTSTLTHTSKYRYTTICFRNIIYQFLYQYCFTHTSTTKQSNFTTLCIRFYQIDYFNTCKQNFVCCTKIFKQWRLSMYCTTTNFAYLWQTINSIARYIKQTTFNTLANRHCYWATSISYYHSTYQSFSTVHRNGTYAIFSQMLLYFKHQFIAVFTGKF